MDDEEYKPAEATLKFYLPVHRSEFKLACAAPDLHSALFEIDQLCRSAIKYGSHRDKSIENFAEMIRELISEFNVRDICE